MKSRKQAEADSSIWSIFLPIAAVLAAVGLWGGSFVSGKIAVTALGPWPLMWSRLTVSALCLLPFYKKMRPRNYHQGDWKLLLLMVACQPCIYFMLETNALRFTTSSQAGVICALIPLLTCLGARLFFKERISGAAWAGLALSICGVAWLTLAGGPSPNARFPMRGNFLQLCAGFSAVAYFLLLQKMSARYSSWTLTGLQTIGGLIFFSPGAPQVISGMGQWPREVVFSVLYLGAAAFMGAFLLYNWAVSRISAAKAAPFINLVPVVAVALGWAFLDESLSTPQLTAVALVICGVFLSQLKPSAKP